jgi:hypothetical protein
MDKILHLVLLPPLVGVVVVVPIRQLALLEVAVLVEEAMARPAGRAAQERLAKVITAALDPIMASDFRAAVAVLRLMEQTAAIPQRPPAMVELAPLPQ